MIDPREPGPELKDAPTLLSDAVQQVTRLIKGEIALAKRELELNAKTACVAAGVVIVGVLLVLTALNVLAAAAVAAIANAGLSSGAAALLVGVVLIAIALGMIAFGLSRLSPDRMAPKRTMQNLRKDIRTLKEKTHA